MESQTLTLGHRSLHQLRSALERSLGVQAAPLLQEAGFASGEAMTRQLVSYSQLVKIAVCSAKKIEELYCPAFF